MRAAWYERNGPAREVLRVGEMPDPVTRPGRGSGPDPRLGRQPLRRQIAGRRAGADRLSPCHSSERWRRNHRRGRRRGGPLAGRAAGLDLQRPMAAALRHGREPGGAAGWLDGAAARERQLRRRRLSRHSRLDGSSGGLLRRAGGAQDRAGHGRGGRRRPLRDPACPLGRGAGPGHGEQRGESRSCAGRGRRGGVQLSRGGCRRGGDGGDGRGRASTASWRWSSAGISR